MRVVLLGGRGMLATDLAREAPAAVDMHPVAHADCDVTDSAAVGRMLDSLRPELVINASAYTAVDSAETERELAERVNGVAVGRLGEMCAGRGARVLHFSTDYVFPGDAARPYREDDPVAPVNSYGASKLLGERLLEASGVEWTVIRTQWLFGANGRSFPRTMWQRARAAQATRVVDDQAGRPTYTVDLAKVTWALVSSRRTGTFHAANQGATTWFGLARYVFERAGVPQLVTPCSTAEYPTPARRPAYSVLDTAKLESVLGAPMPSWESAIDRFLAGDVVAAST